MENSKVVYFHRRKDTNEVFYVGIGTIQRAMSPSGRNRHWKRIVSKYGYDIEIVHEGLTWDEACKYEVKYIKEFGRHNLKEGNLCNMTDGGDGIPNLVITEEHRKNNSLSHQGEKNIFSVLNDKTCMEVRTLYAEGKHSLQDLSNIYGVHRQVIHSCVKGITWKHLPIIKHNRTYIKSFGEKQGTSRLKKEQVLEILRTFKNGKGHGYKKMADKYNVGMSTIRDIIKRRTWPHLTI